jgi:hypothetical protein
VWRHIFLTTVVHVVNVAKVRIDIDIVVVVVVVVVIVYLSKQ